MTAVQTLFHPVSMLLAAALGAIVALARQARSAVLALREEMARRRALDRASALMRTMTDRELADIGLHRGEVDRIAFGDPERQGMQRRHRGDA